MKFDKTSIVQSLIELLEERLDTMGLQKYRVDIEDPPDSDGAIRCYTKWMGGPSLAMIRNCHVQLAPSMTLRRTVYVRDEPDTYFSQPAACKVNGKTVTGWLGCENNIYTFHAHINQ